jgi:hypothetical protein
MSDQMTNEGRLFLRGQKPLVCSGLIAMSMSSLLHFMHPTLAHADPDTIAALSASMTKGASEKQRLSAVLALAKLADRATLKPLVLGLADPSAKVRAAAAVALGRLGHKSSLPALREARTDADELVRKQASQAIALVNKANDLPPEAELTAVATSSPGETGKEIATAKAGFGSSPRVLPSRPELFVLIKTSNDDSPGKLDTAARKSHGDILRSAMKSQLASSKVVSANAEDVDRLGLASRQLDLSVVKLEATRAGEFMEIEAQIRLAVSDNGGKILSMISGGAKVQVQRKSFNAKNMTLYRKQALEGAVAGLFEKLLTHLRKSAQA